VDSVHGVSSGKSVALKINIEGYPPFDIKWYKSSDGSPTGWVEQSDSPPPIGQSNDPVTLPSAYSTGALSGITNYYYYCKVKSPYSDVWAVSDTIRVPVCSTTTPDLDSIRGSASGCFNSIQTYWVPKKTGVTVYHWEIPDCLERINEVNPLLDEDTLIRVRVVNTINSTDTIKVTPRNSCYIDGTPQKLGLLQGYTIENGEYEGPGSISIDSYPNGITFAKLISDSFPPENTSFTSTGNDLCFAKADPLNPNPSAIVMIPYGFSQSAAALWCSNLGAGWRLPNIAELGKLQEVLTTPDVAAEYGITTETSLVYDSHQIITISFYRSSTTTPTDIYDWIWNYGGTTSTNDAWGNFTGDVLSNTGKRIERTKPFRVRCVQTIEKAQ
jgi:hypothetical protein